MANTMTDENERLTMAIMSGNRLPKPTLFRIGRRRYNVFIHDEQVGVVWAPGGNSGRGWSARSEDGRMLGCYYRSRSAAVDAVLIHELRVGEE